MYHVRPEVMINSRVCFLLIYESFVCSTTGTRKLEILLDGVDISEGSFEASCETIGFHVF